MRLLIDSHVLIWFGENDPKLSRRARAQLTQASHEAFLSLASIWELSSKASAGRLDLPDPPETMMTNLGFEMLPVELAHLQRMRELPRHHGDPFDRMLIAQALVEDLLLVTSDRDIARYDVPLLW